MPRQRDQHRLRVRASPGGGGDWYSPLQGVLLIDGWTLKKWPGQRPRPHKSLPLRGRWHGVAVTEGVFRGLCLGELPQSAPEALTAPSEREPGGCAYRGNSISGGTGRRGRRPLQGVLSIEHRVGGGLCPAPSTGSWALPEDGRGQSPFPTKVLLIEGESPGGWPDLGGRPYKSLPL